jgi:hypothetical protein
VGLGVVLAVGGLAYGSSRIDAPAAGPAMPVAGIVAGTERTRDASAPNGASRGRARRAASRETVGAITAHVRRAATRYGLPESLVAAVISVESEFNPRAVSRRGALGLMQLMPTTAAMLGVRDAFDPHQNVDGGARHLRALLDRFSNDVPLALAAYNAGPQAVIRYRGVPPFPETRAFVARVMHRAGAVALPTPAVAHAAPALAPRVRVAHHTVERPRRDDPRPAIIPAALAGQAALVQPAATREEPAAQAAPAPLPPPAATALPVSASAPAPLGSAEAP